MSFDVNLRPVKRQATLGRSRRCHGVELHAGGDAQLTINPAPINSGIVFVRTDVDDRDNIIPVTPNAVTNTLQCTEVSNAAGVSVSTIEHLMAALSASGIDNALIEIDSREIPALDGSSEPFLKMIEDAGIISQAAARSYVKILKPISVKHGEAYARIEPSTSLTLDVTIDFKEAAIGRQRIEIEPDVKSFRDRLASARTFARAHEVVALREAGLSLGGSYDNAIVVDGAEVLNPGGLRFNDEFVRHKALDLLGDMYVAGPVLGRVTTVKAGHAINHALLKAVFADETAWAIVQIIDAPRKKPSEETHVSTLEVDLASL